MSKPINKIVDAKGRIHLPTSLRQSLGIESGDVVTITAGGGSIRIKKAIVMDGSGTISQEAKEAYAETVLREMPADKLARFLELAAKLNQENKK